MLYFLRGMLHCQNVKAKNIKEKHDKIKEKKLGTTIEILCEGFPSEFVTYLSYCRNLKFEDKPDYAYLFGLLKDLFKKSGYERDYEYDWNLIIKGNEEKIQTSDEEKVEEGDY